MVMMEDQQAVFSPSLTAAIFIATATWFIRRQRRKEALLGDEPGVALGQRSLVQREGAHPNIGSRGVAALSPPIPYISGFFKCLQDPYHSTDNPQGHIALCVAENKLVTELLAERLTDPETASAAFNDPVVYGYNSFLGIPVARQASAYFIAKRFLFPEAISITPQQALEHVRMENVAIGSGCAALLNYSFFILGEEGDACIIPAPYYAAFENDMNAMAKCKPWPCYMANASVGPTENELDIAFLQASSKGLRVKFLLLCNPNNPLGTIYREDVIANAIKWARKRSLHTIVDEIYALSTLKKDNHGFKSVVRVLENNLGNDVHMLWALSKDFGASGFRVGILYSQNQDFLEALGNLSIFSGVSQPIQMAVAEMLTDDQWVDGFLETARARLSASYEICLAKLEEMVVPFIPAEAGIFIYIDLSSLLPEKTFEGEARLSDIMVQYARIVLTPGESQRERTPGMFRICYAWVSPDVLEIAMERLSRLVGKIRKLDWDDLNENTLQSIVQ